MVYSKDENIQINQCNTIQCQSTKTCSTFLSLILLQVVGLCQNSEGSRMSQPVNVS